MAKVTAYTVPAKVRQDIVNYLSSKPWGEVNPMLAPLLQSVVESAWGKDEEEEPGGTD